MDDDEQSVPGEPQATQSILVRTMPRGYPLIILVAILSLLLNVVWFLLFLQARLLP